MENMKRTKQEIKKDHAAIEFDSDAYPWGLRITLEGSVLQKLGLTDKDFTVGETCYLAAKAECTRISTEDVSGRDDGSQKDVSISLQVTDLSVQNTATSAAKDFDDAFGKD